MSDFELKDDLLYDNNDNWIKKIDDNKILFGITDFALKKANEIIFIELPEVERKIMIGEVIGSMESSKWSGEIHSPVSGIIKKVNESLEDSPEQMNESPYDNGWICEIEMEDKKDFDKLMNITLYKERIGE